MINTWSRQNLKMTDDVIFLKFASSDDVAKINSKAKNLPQSNQ